MSGAQAVRARGRDDAMHLGWIEGRVCLGLGPVRARLTPREAAQLVSDMVALLKSADRSPCGCEEETNGGQAQGSSPARRKAFEEW